MRSGSLAIWRSNSSFDTLIYGAVLTVLWLMSRLVESFRGRSKRTLLLYFYDYDLLFWSMGFFTPAFFLCLQRLPRRFNACFKLTIKTETTMMRLTRMLAREMYATMLPISTFLSTSKVKLMQMNRTYWMTRRHVSLKSSLR